MAESHPSAAARLLKLVALLSAAGCILLWIVFLWWNPYGSRAGPASGLTAVLMIVSWGAGAVFIHRDRVVSAYAVSAVAFFPVGLYLLGTPGIFLWIGVLTILYFAATLLLHLALRRRRPG